MVVRLFVLLVIHSFSYILPLSACTFIGFFVIAWKLKEERNIERKKNVYKTEAIKQIIGSVVHVHTDKTLFFSRRWHTETRICSTFECLGIWVSFTVPICICGGKQNRRAALMVIVFFLLFIPVIHLRTFKTTVVCKLHGRHSTPSRSQNHFPTIYSRFIQTGIFQEKKRNSVQCIFTNLK